VLKAFDGRVAAVTGAASGIGRALALELTRRGARLALCDVDDDGLAETRRQCEAAGATVTARAVDVADRQAVHEWADAVVADHGVVNLVVNNAGVALAATVEAMSYEDLEWLLGVNFWGVVHGTKAFLPHLKASGEGHIVNVSSVFGLVSVPTQAAYNAAKFAVRGFTDTLRMELELDGSGVSATTVHPGGIRTNIARSARIDPGVASLAGGDRAARDGFDRVAMTSPERAARRILDAVARDRRRVLVGPDAFVIDLLARLPAAVAQELQVAALRRRR
jgi:butyryl-CoA dehydrogenase